VFLLVISLTRTAVSGHCSLGDEMCGLRFRFRETPCQLARSGGTFAVGIGKEAQGCYQEQRRCDEPGQG